MKKPRQYIQRNTPLRRLTPLKRKTPIKRQYKPKEVNPDLQNYFVEGIRISTWECEECGGFIPHTHSYQRYAAQCHILPKRIFESVKSLLINRLHLCLACHTNFDSSWDRASKMKVFAIAIERLKTFVNLLTERETSKLPEIITHALTTATPLVYITDRSIKATPAFGVDRTTNRNDPADQENFLQEP